MSTYQYKTNDETLSITETTDGSVLITRSWRDSQGRLNHRMMDLSAVDRQAAAQALAGDDYVVEAKLADWERELLEKQTRIDPADVKVGDVVEVEAGDGSWLVRGQVRKVDKSDTDYPIQVSINHGESRAVWPSTANATMRLVRRAEPEPDPEQVRALWNLGHEVGEARGEPLLSHDECRELVRHGVTVRGAS